MKTKHLLITTMALSLLTCLWGCSKERASPKLPISDLSYALQLHWWDIKLPDDIVSGKYLEVCFVDQEGNQVGSQRTSVRVGPSSETVRVLFRALESDEEETLGKTVGYAVNIFFSDGYYSEKSRFVFKNIIPKTCNTSQSQNNGEVVNVGDVLVLFSPDNQGTSLSSIEGSQIGLTTKIVDKK